VQAAVGGPLSALVVLRPTDSPGRARPRPYLDRLHPEAAERYLRDNLFGGTTDRYSDLFGRSLRGSGSESISPAALCASLARAVPAFEYGRDADSPQGPQAVSMLAVLGSRHGSR
jgi:hypothetical protein